MMTIKTRHNLQHRRTAISQTSALQESEGAAGNLQEIFLHHKINEEEQAFWMDTQANTI
jgi:hypothetical protein